MGCTGCARDFPSAIATAIRPRWAARRSASASGPTERSVRTERPVTGLRRALRALACALCLLFAATAQAQPRYGLPADAYVLFARWLDATCVGDEAQRLR